MKNLIEYVVEDRREFYKVVGNEVHMVDVICSIYDHEDDWADFANAIRAFDCPELKYVRCIPGSPREEFMTRKEEFRTFIFALPVTLEGVNEKCNNAFATKLGEVAKFA